MTGIQITLLGQHVRIRSVDREYCEKRPDAAREAAGRADSRQLIEPAGELTRGIRIERDARLLTDTHVLDVGLAHARPHAHPRRVDHFEDRLPAARRTYGG